MLHAPTTAALSVATRFGAFQLHRFATSGGEPVLALTRGDVSGRAPLLARIHSSCLTSEFLGGLDCDCAEQLGHALAAIAADGRGVLLYLLQEGRGAGLLAKARDRMMVQAHGERITTFEAFDRLGLPGDRRSYEAVAGALAALGIEAPLRLLTQNPEKHARLAAAGVAIVERVRLPSAHSRWNAHYLRAKARQGHQLSLPSAPGARLPERVDWFEPQALRELPRFLRAACYLLPVPERWLRATVYWDRALARERLVLEPLHGARGLGRVQGQALVDRLPLEPTGETQRAFREAVTALGEGRARALLVLDADEEATPDAETRGLLELGRAA